MIAIANLVIPRVVVGVWIDDPCKGCPFRRVRYFVRDEGERMVAAVALGTGDWFVWMPYENMRSIGRCTRDDIDGTKWSVEMIERATLEADRFMGPIYLASVAA